jgi:hypothetical protein
LSSRRPPGATENAGDRLASRTTLILYVASPQCGIPHMAGSFLPAFVQGCLSNALFPLHCP